ncbi:hypothetical protein ACKFKF_12390 [Phormidesmis sp. 146-12]
MTAKVKVIDHGCADLSVLTLAQMFREGWEVTGRIGFKAVREGRVLRLLRVGLAKWGSDRLRRATHNTPIGADCF